MRLQIWNGINRNWWRLDLENLDDYDANGENKSKITYTVGDNL